jgi:CRP/FNR family cyclic AMP-dependent transcriptional regulator
MKNLTKFSIFDKLSATQLGEIHSILQEKSFEAGQVITRENEVGDELFLLLKGKVEVSKSLTLMVGRGDLDTRDKSLIQLKADDYPFFGEMAILREDSKRSATVRALEHCLVGIIKRKDLVDLCEADTNLGYRVLGNIAKTLADHLEKADRDISKLTTAFSLALQMQ